jgi:hypothetical protein
MLGWASDGEGTKRLEGHIKRAASQPFLAEICYA